MKITWKKEEHHIHKEMRTTIEMMKRDGCGSEQIGYFKTILSRFPKYHYKSEMGSIIPPSDITMQRWELMDCSGEVNQFETLAKAKAYAKKVYTSNQNS